MPTEEPELYTAQKVHTLAQIVFQRLAGSWAHRAPWTGTSGYVVPASYGQWPGPSGVQAVPPRPGAAGSAPLDAHPPALFYWYP